MATAVRRKPIPIDKTKRCKAIVGRNVGNFCKDGTVAEVSATPCAPLSVFLYGQSYGLYRNRREAVSFLRWLRSGGRGKYAKEDEKMYCVMSRQFVTTRMIAIAIGVVMCLTQGCVRDEAKELHDLGQKYLDGNGVEGSASKAFDLFRESAELGNAEAQWKVGLLYENGLDGVVSKNPRKALKWYRESAEQGYVEAQVSLGNCYVKGAGVAKNPREAARWYRMAAEQGSAFAQTQLGSFYELGLGVQKDQEKAIRLYRQAADQGEASAQYLLGLSYLGGHGVKKDSGEAKLWFRKAAVQGHKAAKEQLEKYY